MPGVIFCVFVRHLTYQAPSEADRGQAVYCVAVCAVCITCGCVELRDLRCCNSLGMVVAAHLVLLCHRCVLALYVSQGGAAMRKVKCA